MKASTQSRRLLTALQFTPVNPGARPPFQRRCYWEAPAPSVSPQTRGSVQPNANASQGRSSPKAGEGAGEGMLHIRPEPEPLLQLAWQEQPVRGQAERMRQWWPYKTAHIWLQGEGRGLLVF